MVSVPEVTAPSVEEPPAGSPRVVLVTSSKRIFHPRHYHLLARGLYDAGVDVVVVGQPAEHEEAPTVPVHLVPSRRSRIARMLSGPLVLRQALSLEPDLVQLNSLELLPWGVLVRRLTGRPVTYDCNEDYAGYMLQKAWIPRPLRRPLSRLVATLEPWLAGQLDAVTFADRATAGRFSRVRAQRLVVHNFPWRRLAEGPTSTRWRFDVTYHGSLPDYHARALLETARILRQRGLRLRWCIAAREFSGGEQGRLQALVDEAGLREEVTLRFNVPFLEIPSLLAETRLGLIPLPDTPKFRRNIPRKVFEFMGVSRPAVVSDLPPTRSLIGHTDSCLLVTPGDEAAYADGIQRLMEDPDLADEMGRRGRELILSELNAETELAPYVELCRSLSAAARRC